MNTSTVNPINNRSMPLPYTGSRNLPGKSKKSGLGLEYFNKSVDYDSVNISLENTKDGGMIINFDYTSYNSKAEYIKAGINGKNAIQYSVAQRVMEEFFHYKMEIELTPEEVAKLKEKDSSEDPLANLPEYWNAENTSQRIVDFALSFFDLSSVDAKEYFNIIKDAIDEGFSKAREMLKDVPDFVSSLVDDTYSKVMEKLNNWLDSFGENKKSEKNVPDAE